MKAYIYSSINAHSLLHRLAGMAQGMPEIYSRATVPDHAGSTASGQLHLSGRVADDVLTATIDQLDDRSLTAKLDNDISLDPAVSKRRLGDFLGPLLRQYNTTPKQGLAGDDQVLMVFEDDAKKA